MATRQPGAGGVRRGAEDAETGEVIAEDGKTLGVASNNVAEYNGLIAGLKLAAEFAPGASIEVRVDSKLVVEQMSGDWKIKHPDMKPLAFEAKRLAPPGTTYTWVPREQNKHADRLVNDALDGKRLGVSVSEAAAAEVMVDVSEAGAEEQDEKPAMSRGWAAPAHRPPG